MKVITIHCWKRPHYLIKVLESIKRADPGSGYILLIGLEPGGGTVISDVCDRAEEISGITSVIIRNRRRLGHIQNPKNLLTYCMDHDVESVVYLEEDVVISPDALRMAEWYMGLPASKRDTFLCLNFFNFKSVEYDHTDPRYWRVVPYACDYRPVHYASPWNSLGCVFSREQLKWVLPTFDAPDPTDSWNWRVFRLVESGLVPGSLHPLLSRSNHIGRDGGMFCQPQYHDSVFARHCMARMTGGEYLLEV